MGDAEVLRAVRSGRVDVIQVKVVCRDGLAADSADSAVPLVDRFPANLAGLPLAFATPPFVGLRAVPGVPGAGRLP